MEMRRAHPNMTLAGDYGFQEFSYYNVNYQDARSLFHSERRGHETKLKYKLL